MENVIVNNFKCNSNGNILHCLQHVIVIERKLSNSNLLHCNVIDPRPAFIFMLLLFVCPNHFRLHL